MFGAASMVDPLKVAAFFECDIGRRLSEHNNVIREFKFSVMEDGDKYYPGMDNERILLQGVVDCAMIDNDGIIIIDFKTDRITEETLETASEKYRPQLTAYSEALSRIYKAPVKGAYLYFFEINASVKIIG